MNRRGVKLLLMAIVFALTVVNSTWADNFNELKKRADKGDAKAQNKLGTMYFSGQGLSRDYTEAMKWFRKAADQGYADAQYNLGTLYVGGLGVTQNYTEAVRWFRKAADQGSPEALKNLGVAYVKGLGAPQDFVQALKWLTLSKKQGNAGAAELCNVLASKMTSQQITEAENMARQWKQKTEYPQK